MPEMPDHHSWHFPTTFFITSIMFMPCVMVMVDQPVSDCFCILQTCLLPQQLPHLCRGLITLGTTPSPDRTQLEGKRLLRKAGVISVQDGSIKKAKAYLVSGSIIRGDAKYASLSQVTTLCCIKPRTRTLHQLGTHSNFIKLRICRLHQAAPS